MKVAITTLGTRGDLQPFLALGLGLMRAGYDVTMVSAKRDEQFVTDYGMKFYPLDVDVQKIMESDAACSMTKGDNPIKFVKSHVNASRQLKKEMIAVLEQMSEACAGMDVIIYHPGMPNGYFLAKQMGIVAIMASPFPVTPTADYPSILFYNGPRLGKWYNLLTHYIFERAFWAISKSAIVDFWKRRNKADIVGSTPVTQLQVKSNMPVVYGYSECFFTRPSNWPGNIHVTGSWMLEPDSNWQPPEELVSFIQSGEKPVYIGFGSIKDVDGFNEVLQVIVEALHLTGQRGIIALGWNKMQYSGRIPSEVFLLDSAPHSWLFNHVKMVVHHGGAGTTVAGLLAGKPTIIIPHTADQPAWGKRVYELGLGPMPIARRELTARKLANAIQQAPQYEGNAVLFSNKLKAERGVENAVGLIDNYLKSQSSE